MISRIRNGLYLASIAVLWAFFPTTDKASAQEETLKRTPAPVMSYRGAPWLERRNRDAEQQPYKVIKALGMKPGDIVADLGVGTGYFARKMAKAVLPGGTVYGVDIQPEMLKLLQDYCKEEGITNVIPVLGDGDDPKLRKGSLDWILLADVYHEFQQPEAMLEKMLEALKPDGRCALLEYRLLGTTAVHIKIEHRMSPEQVLSEWEAAGFELVDLLEFLPTQHLFIFKAAAKKKTAPPE